MYTLYTSLHLFTPLPFPQQLLDHQTRRLHLQPQPPNIAHSRVHSPPHRMGMEWSGTNYLGCTHVRATPMCPVRVESLAQASWFGTEKSGALTAVAHYEENLCIKHKREIMAQHDRDPFILLFPPECNPTPIDSGHFCATWLYTAHCRLQPWRNLQTFPFSETRDGERIAGPFRLLGGSFAYSL